MKTAIEIYAETMDELGHGGKTIEDVACASIKRGRADMFNHLRKVTEYYPGLTASELLDNLESDDIFNCFLGK